MPKRRERACTPGARGGGPTEMAALPNVVVPKRRPRPQAHADGTAAFGRLIRLTFQVGDLVGLGVGLLLGAAELFLRLALALLLLALAAQAGVVRQVARCLLHASGHLVHDAHDFCLLGGYVLPKVVVPQGGSRKASMPTARRRLVLR